MRRKTRPVRPGTPRTTSAADFAQPDARRQPAAGPGPMPPHLLPDDRRDARQQVAEVVGEIGVVPGDEALVGEVAVGAERHLAHEVVAERRRRRCRRRARRGRSGSARVLDIFSPPTSSHPWTMKCAGGSMPAARHIAGHQTQWKRMMSLPIRWWTAGHHFAKRSGSLAVADGGDVVDEGVVPDVEDVLVVPGDRDPPVDRRPRDRDVLQAAA